MKKIIFIILAAAALASGIGIYYKIKTAKLPIEKILPKEALLYVRISDIEKSLEEFKATPLWWNIRDIDVELLLEKSGLTQEEIAKYDIFKSEFIRFVGELLLDKFFGQELAFAIYPSKISTLEDPQVILDMASNIILVTRLKPEAEFVEFLSNLFDKFGQKVQIKHEEYRGRRISIVELTDKLNIAYVKIRDLLVIGLGERAAHACLDVLAGEETPLSRDRDYISTISHLPKAAQTLAYVNLGLFLPNLKHLINITPETRHRTAEEKAKILQSFDKVAGFKAAGFASVGGEISKHKTILLFDKASMDPTVARFYSFKPAKNNTINFVPKNVIYYQWSNCFNAKLSWDNLRRELSRELPQEVEKYPAGPSPEEMIKGIEDALGTSIEREIIPALGNEAGGFLSDINFEGPIPIPEILIFIKINDKTVIEGVIDSLTEKNKLLMRSEECNGTYIKYISLPFGASFQPGYCFLDDYLLISTRWKLLKESIDASSSKFASLMANKDFQDINFGLTDENNAIFFLKSDVLLGEIREICEWGVSWASLMSANLEAYQQKAEQLLDNLKTGLQIKEQELKQLNTDSVSLKEAIRSLQSQGLDVSFKQEELSSLEAKIKKQEEKIELAKKDLEEKEKQLKDMVQNSPVAKIDLSLVRLYLDEAVYPLLDGFQTFKATGSRSVFSENIFETQSFSKTKK